MKNLRTIDVPGNGPEDPLFDEKGNLYTGLKNSNALVKVVLKDGSAEKIAELDGHPLGLDWLPDGRILVCCSEAGMQAVDIASGKVEQLEIKGETLHLCNNPHVLPDGTILVSDSSSKFDVLNYNKDLVQNTSTGRLLKVDPDGQATVLLDGLCFANGVAWLEDQNAALIAATGTCDIQRVDLTTGAVSKFADVDGHPDNIATGSDGRVWVAIPSVKNEALARLHQMPLWLRVIASHLPPALQPKPKLCCRVQVFNPDGSHYQTHNGDTGIFNMVTGVREADGVVALGSIEHDFIAVFELD